MTTPPPARAVELAEALAGLRARLTDAANTAGRRVDEIELLPVTKFFPASDVIILRNLGCEDFGESREQEAANKIAEVAHELSGEPIRWHMVGRIQRNKAKAIGAWAHTAHSVDSAKVVTALGRAATAALAEGTRAEPLQVYIQISLDGDADRGGLDVTHPDGIDEVCAVAADTEGVQFVGLMGIPPLGADPGSAFERLHTELDRVQADYQQRLGLSAGMSGDLESAVQHGSTCVRVGTALMGNRPLTSPGVVTPVTSSSQTPAAEKGPSDEHTA